jgi:hypothetical protein
VLEDREGLRRLLDGDQEGLEQLRRPLVVGQQVVGVAAAGAAARDLHALPLLHQLRAAVVDLEVAEQRRQRHAERACDAVQALEARRGLPVLDARQHAAADLGALRDVRDGQPLARRRSRIVLPT